MNEQRQDAYLKLIDQLLVSPADLAETILRANSHLIDAGLIQKLEQEAEILKKRGYCNQADFLMNTATELIDLMQFFSERAAYLLLIEQVFRAAPYINLNQQVLHSFLSKNVGKIDNNFANLLKLKIDYILQNLDFCSAHKLAENILVFSNFLLNFH